MGMHTPNETLSVGKVWETWGVSGRVGEWVCDSDGGESAQYPAAFPAHDLWISGSVCFLLGSRSLLVKPTDTRHKLAMLKMARLLFL